MDQPKKRSRMLLFAVLTLAVVALVALFALTQCAKEQEPLALDQDFIMEIVDIDMSDPRSFAEGNLPMTECSLAATLYITDGPGEPGNEGEQTSGKHHEYGSKQAGAKVAYTSLQSSLGSIIAPIKPVIPIIPIPIDPPSEQIKVLNPDVGSKLVAESDFVLKWSIDSGRDLTIDILFSADGGSSYQEIALGIKNNDAYSLKLPNIKSDNCVFRVNAWVGTVLLGYNYSPSFQVIAPLQTTPAPPIPIPDLVKKYPTPSYIADNNAFINENEDSSRWFYVEHDLPDVSEMVWQMSRIPFPCEENGSWASPPGLLAWAPLTKDTDEFEVDFGSILRRLQGLEQSAAMVERGVAFETVPEIVLLRQTQRLIYVRVLLLDSKAKLIGATRSEFQIVYGKPIMEQTSLIAISLLTDLPRPELLVKTSATGSYRPMPDMGITMFAGGNRNWSFILEKVPLESVEVDFQVSVLPFKQHKMSDLQDPAGLVYRSRATDLSYTNTSRYYHLSFAEFAPSFFELGPKTINYYFRAVCYVPGESPGTVLPLVSKSYLVQYTGNQQQHNAGIIDFDNLPPEEVEVKSYVPETKFWSYVPAQWSLPNHQEYFEVTRPIQAEEICFYIKNHKTGDFLLPFVNHMMSYPGTTREQYQAIVDRMLPPGAWFRLTITQSNWSKIWNDFISLISQIYANIQKHYNGFKHSIANLVADRFAFLGSDAQSYIRKAVGALMDYGLASIGLPPSLPNFEELTQSGLRYSVWVALEEAAHALGVPPDQVPHEVRNAIADEATDQLKSLTAMKHVNPLNVGYLKPATKAMYRPAWVAVNIRNPHDEWSPSGTLTISYYPVGKGHFKIYKYVSIPIPSISPQNTIFMKVHLKPDNTHLPIWNQYYWGDIGECSLNITATYHVPDIETAAKQQGASGLLEILPDAYFFDIDPVYTYSAINVPGEYLGGN